VPRYHDSDVTAIKAGLVLVESGVPLGELLALGRRHDAAMREIAQEAVDLFACFVRDPIRGSARAEQEASEQLVSAFFDMLTAVDTLVSHHFRSLTGRRQTAARARRCHGDKPKLTLAVRDRVAGGFG
jgi:hypothetical protein